MFLKKRNKSNLTSPDISDNLYWILITGGSESGQTNMLLNLSKNQIPGIKRTYLFV